MDWKAFLIIFLAIVAAELVVRKVIAPSTTILIASPTEPQTSAEYIQIYFPGAITV